MQHGYGITRPDAPAHAELRAPARHLVVIDSAGGRVARLFTATGQPAGEFDASAEEVAVMTRGLSPVAGAGGAEWDAALSGHTPAERAGALVFALDV